MPVKISENDEITYSEISESKKKTYSGVSDKKLKKMRYHLQGVSENENFLEILKNNGISLDDEDSTKAIEELIKQLSKYSNVKKSGDIRVKIIITLNEWLVMNPQKIKQICCPELNDKPFYEIISELLERGFIVVRPMSDAKVQEYRTTGQMLGEPTGSKYYSLNRELPQLNHQFITEVANEYYRKWYDQMKRDKRDFNQATEQVKEIELIKKERRFYRNLSLQERVLFSLNKLKVGVKYQEFEVRNFLVNSEGVISVTKWRPKITKYGQAADKGLLGYLVSQGFIKENPPYLEVADKVNTECIEIERRKYM